MSLEDNEHYHNMQQLAPFGFIDPLTDLGTFNDRLMKFNEPVESLVNTLTGMPFSERWYSVLEELRSEYILWQKDLVEGYVEDERRSYTKAADFDAEVRPIVESYLRLGFPFDKIAERVGYSQKTLRNNYRRSDLIESHEPVIWIKQDLKENRQRKRKNFRPSAQW